MTAPALCLLLLCSSACAPPEEPHAPAESDRAAPNAEEWTPPGPRVRVAGLLGFQARSRVRFLDAEGRLDEEAGELRLTATYAFPDRARWQLEPPEGEPSDRRLLFVYGSGVWAVQPRSAESVPLTGEEARAVRLMFLLRRAALTFPAGLEWKGADEWRTARAPGGLVLRARLGDDGLPREIESRLDDGPVHERLVDLAWAPPEANRRLPRGWTLVAQGRSIWREELLSFDTRARHVDDFFLPPDRRRVRNASGASPVGLVVVPLRAERRVPLEPPPPWPEVRSAFDRLREAEAQVLGARGRDLERTPRVELDEAGRPVALLLVLADGEPPPEGYALVGEGNAVATALEREPPVDPGDLRRLREGVPPGAQASGPVRAELRPRGAEGPPARLVLPLEPGG